MVKILSLVSYKIFPATSGGQKGIALFNAYLSQERSLVCVTVKSNEPRYAKGYVLLNILSNAAYRYLNLFYFFTLQKLVRSHRITHVVLEHPYFGWLGMLLKFTGIKLVIHSHNIESLRWKSLGKWWWKILWWYERATHLAADYNFFITDHDREYAVENFHLHASRCITVPYGTEARQAPLKEERARCKKFLQVSHHIEPEAAIFLFNGALDYSPNYHAVQAIVQQINPILLQQGFAYKIIVCGKGLPAEMNGLKEYAHRHIIYAGFVEDIDVYFKGADVFLNPVIEGGGIKTKLIEALGYNLNVVSTANGATGVDSALCNGKLLVCNNTDWTSFATLAIEATKIKTDIQPAYFDHFYWKNLVTTAAAFIEHA